jgi:hypothetical protein
MKTERRHELQTNVLADWLGEKVEQAQGYSKAIVASLAAIAVLAGVYFYLARKSADDAERAWERYFDATDTASANELLNVADQNANTLAGRWARLSLADSQYGQAIDQLFEDRTEAKSSLDKALENYRQVRDQSKEPDLLERSTIGLARTYESEDKLADARREYQMILDRWPLGVFGDEAKGRLEDLNKQSTKIFYDWFAQQKTRPWMSHGGADPGTKPKFDINSLPSDEPQSTPETKADGTPPGVSISTEAAPDKSSSNATSTPAGSTPPGSTPAASTPAATPKEPATKPAESPK